MKKVLIKFLKNCLRKLDGIKRVEFKMSDSNLKKFDESRLMEQNAMFLKNIKESGHKQKVEFEEENYTPTCFCFEHNFKVQFDEIPPHLFYEINKISKKRYLFGFFVAKYGETDILDKINELKWKIDAEDLDFNVNIDVFDTGKNIFKKIQLKKCKIQEVSFFNHFSYYGKDELLRGDVIVEFDSIEIM